MKRMPIGRWAKRKGACDDVMNYKWAKDFTLQLISQYSIAGSEVKSSYNNQADYIKRIPKLLDDAAVHIATGARKIRTITALESLTKRRMGQWVLYELPEDCWQVCSGGLIRTDGAQLHRYSRYRLLGDNGIAVPGTLDGEMQLEYFRYPALLGDSPADTAALDNAVEAQMAMPYYAAALLVMADDSFAYAALMNEYEAKLTRMGERPQGEITIIEDAYNAGEADQNE